MHLDKNGAAVFKPRLQQKTKLFDTEKDNFSRASLQMTKGCQLKNTYTSLNIMLRSPSGVVPLSTLELTPKQNHQHTTDKADNHAGKVTT
jgi:hypothetical protein